MLILFFFSLLFAQNTASCPKNYCLISGSTDCQPCIAHCEEYSSNTVCKTCEMGYSVNSKDPSQCQTCTASTRNYYLYPDDKICLPDCDYPYYSIEPSSYEKLCILGLSASDIKSAENLGKGANAGGILSTVSGWILTAIDTTSPSAFTLSSFNKMLQYMKYLDVNYSPKLYVMFKTQKITSTGLHLIPSMGESSKENIPDRSLPDKLALNGLDSSFLVNFWQSFVTLLIIFFVILVASAVETYLVNYQKAFEIAQKINSFLRWNILLTVFCSYYSDLAFYTTVEFSTFEFDAAVPVISFIICLAVNTLGFFIVVFMMKAIARFRVQKHQYNLALTRTTGRRNRQQPVEDFRRQFLRYSMVYKDFKEEIWWQQIFVMIFCIRAYLYGLFVGFMYDYPIVLAVLLMLFGGIVLGYLLVKRPMKKLIDFIQQIFCEIILLVVNFCVFLTAIIDKKESADNSSKDGLSSMIIGMNIIMSWSLPVFAVIQGVLIARKSFNAKKEVTLPIENKQPPIENNGPNLSSIQVLETFDNSPMRIPRVQAARPRPSTELDVSNYQVSEHDGSMIELRKGFQSRQSSVVEIRNGGTLSYINGA